jgi:hypothetical protein
VAYLTGFDIDFSIAAEGVAVLGSFVSPDIFDNLRSVSGTMTFVRADFANPILFDAETEFAVHIMLQEPGAVPRGCIGMYLGRVKFMGLSAPAGGGTGPKTETLPFKASPKVAATGFDGSIATFSSSGT